MSLVEYAKRAAVRRVVFVLVALALGALGIGNARAADLIEGGREYHVSEGAAYQACEAQKAVAQGIKPTWEYFECVYLSAQRVYKTTANHAGYYVGQWQCKAGQTSGGATYACNSTAVGFNGAHSAYFWWREGESCPIDQPPQDDGTCAPTQAECLARSRVLGDWEGDGTGMAVCYDGCVYTDSLDPESSNGITYDPTGDACSANDYPSPTPFVDTDGDGTRDTDDAFPNDPNEDTDTDGDGTGDNADTDPDDPDNGEDSGVGDESDNEASGGGNCAAPPTCSGDAIACAQLHQQWKISCALGAKVTGSPEACETAYTCTGDSVQCASIALLRKTACKDAVSGGGASDEILEGLSNGPADQEGDPMSVWNGPEASFEADEEGYLTNRTCPQPPTFTVGGHTRTIDTEALCDLGDVVAALVLLMAAAHALWAFTGS